MPAEAINIGVEYRAYNATLRQRRLDLGLTQVQLATLAGVSPQVPGEMERLRRVRKTPEALRVLAALGLGEDAQPEWIEMLELHGTRRIEQSVDAQLMGSSPLALLGGPDAEAPDAGEIAVRDAGGAEVREAVARLPHRERRVLQLRYGIGDNYPHTLAEVGKRLGFTAERASQLEERALKKLSGTHLNDDGQRQIDAAREREHADREAKGEALRDWMLRRDRVVPHAR